MGTGLTLYLHISPRTAWSFSYIWGESTHFVHDNNPEYPDGTPLNKEYSISVMVAWFYLSISYTRELGYTSDN